MVSALVKQNVLPSSDIAENLVTHSDSVTNRDGHMRRCGMERK
jgi:hypothetical protein